jgi:hypothetical protein
MTLRVDYLGIAEGAIFDARGGLAVVGFSPQALIAESLPSQLAFHLIMIAEDEDEGSKGSVLLAETNTVSIKIQLTAPDGQVVFFVDQKTPLQAVRVPDLPPRMMVVAVVPFTAAKAGAYRVTLTLTVPTATGDATADGERIIRVVEQPKTAPSSVSS